MSFVPTGDKISAEAARQLQPDRPGWFKILESGLDWRPDQKRDMQFGLVEGFFSQEWVGFYDFFQFCRGS